MILLVGQAPSRTSDPADALSFASRSGARLLGLSGLAERDFRARTRRVNLCDRWPGRAGKGDAPPREFDELTILDELGQAMGRRWPILFVGRLTADRLLGARVARQLDVCEWYVDLSPSDVAILPHPSGVNRWWNEPRNVRLARAFLREALGVRGGRAASPASPGRGRTRPARPGRPAAGTRPPRSRAARRSGAGS